MTRKKVNLLFITTLILVIIHFCGLLGMMSPYKETFILLTPLNLLITTVLLFINQKEFNRHFYIFCAFAFVAGYLIELAGVRSGFIFGEYTYGPSLGLKLFDVPLVMGLNWLMLTFSVGVICNKLRTGKLVKCICGALLLVILDFFIEPVAIESGFWSWKEGSVPAQNYIAWYAASIPLLLVFYSLKFNKDNEFAKALYLVQLVFFVLLSIF
ncbi:MAG: carotenoid biosynthesis protein [Bacteroidota bacterium]|nr:carotenoid biosynthesis protein [Bacteroidota bacterium]